MQRQDSLEELAQLTACTADGRGGLPPADDAASNDARDKEEAREMLDAWSPGSSAGQAAGSSHATPLPTKEIPITYQEIEGNQLEFFCEDCQMPWTCSKGANNTVTRQRAQHVRKCHPGCAPMRLKTGSASKAELQQGMSSKGRYSDLRAKQESPRKPLEQTNEAPDARRVSTGSMPKGRPVASASSEEYKVRKSSKNGLQVSVEDRQGQPSKKHSRTPQQAEAGRAAKYVELAKEAAEDAAAKQTAADEAQKMAEQTKALAVAMQLDADEKQSEADRAAAFAWKMQQAAAAEAAEEARAVGAEKAAAAEAAEAAAAAAAEEKAAEVSIAQSAHMPLLTQWLEGYETHIDQHGNQYSTKFVHDKPINLKQFANIVRRVGQAYNKYPHLWGTLAAEWTLATPSSTPPTFHVHLNTIFTQLPSLSPPPESNLALSIVNGENVDEAMFAEMLPLAKESGLHPDATDDDWRVKLSGDDTFDIVLKNEQNAIVAVASCMLFRTIQGKPVLYISTFFAKSGERGLGQKLYGGCRELVKLCNSTAGTHSDGIIGATFMQCVTYIESGRKFWESIDMEVAPSSQKASFLVLQAAMSHQKWYESTCEPKMQVIYS